MFLLVNKDKAEPGQGVNILAKASAGSFVALLGIDKSATLLGSGNDIDMDRILADFSLYDRVPNSNEKNVKKYSDFDQSNAFIITNARNGKIDCNINQKEVAKGPKFEDDSDDVLISDDPDDSTGTSEVRKFFPETWIFNDFKIDETGKKMISTKVKIVIV